MFDARTEAAKLPTEPFQFIGMDGETYQLPNVSGITGHQAERLFGGDLTVIRELASEREFEAVMAFPVRLQLGFADAWTAHARESGKEDSQSSPTPSSEKPSK